MKIKYLAAAVGLLVAGGATANELIASVEQAKGGALVVGLDLVSDGSVAGFSFAVDIPVGDAKAVRSGNCVSQLPKGFTAQCAYNQGKLFVIASADSVGSTLPAGLVPVGTLTVASPLSKGASVRISGFETSNDNGVSTPGSAKVDGVDMGDTAAEPVEK